MTKRQFELINDEGEIRSFIEERELKCWHVIGTDDLVVLGHEDRRGHLQEISVDQFINTLKENGLALYLQGSSGYYRIMKAPMGKRISSNDNDWEDTGW